MKASWIIIMFKVLGMISFCWIGWHIYLTIDQSSLAGSNWLFSLIGFVYWTWFAWLILSLKIKTDKFGLQGSDECRSIS